MKKVNNDSATFSQICNTAILRSGATSIRGVREAIFRLVVTLIEYKRYSSFTKEELIRDFKEFYNLSITSIMFGEVLPDLIRKEGIIRKSKEGGSYIVNKEAVSRMNLLKPYEDFIRQSDLLLDEFVRFSGTTSTSLSRDDARRVLTLYIEDRICSLGMVTNQKERLDDKELYIVSQFIDGIKNASGGFYEVFENLLVGRMLASFVASNEKTVSESTRAFGKMTIFLDSGFIFNLLGLDDYSSPTEYRELVTTLRRMGVKLCVFDHTYNEVTDIIQSSIRWINNPEYSLGKASHVNQHFIDARASEEEIDEWIFTLKTKLEECGVFVVETDIDYNESDVVYQENIKQMIIDDYRASDTYKENKEQTYDLDAKSIYAIHKKRRGKTFKRLEEAGYIFLTTNRGLSRVARRLNAERNDTNDVPLVLTDTFLSVLLFLVNPEYSKDANERFCIPAAFHMFEPGRELVKKIETTLSELQSKGLMSKNDAFSWKTNTSLKKRILMETENDPDNFNEDTPAKIIDSIAKKAEERVGTAVEEKKRAIQKYIDACHEKRELAEKYKLDLYERQKRLDDQLIVLEKRIDLLTKWIYGTLLGVFYAIAFVLVVIGIWLAGSSTGVLSYCMAAVVAFIPSISIPKKIRQPVKRGITSLVRRFWSKKIIEVTAEKEKLGHSIEEIDKDINCAIDAD